MKRIVSVLLVVCVLTSMISVGMVTSSASTISSSEDYYTYKESYIKNYCTYDYLVNEMRLPYRAFVETLDKDTAFQVELDAWKLATISPDSLVTEITQSQQCKYYEAILIDLLVRNTQEESFIENVQSFKDSIHVSAWKKYINYNSNILNNTPITSENANVLLKEMKRMGIFGKALKYADTIGDYIDYAVDMYDLFDKLCKVEMIAQMSDSYAQVLSIMSSKCGSNVYLKTAIDNVNLIFSDDITVKQIQYIFATKSAANAVYEEFMKEVKKQVISYLGMAGLAIDLAQSVGTVVANSWFGTEDMINDYYEMSSLYEIEDLLRTAVLNTNGSTFCAAFKMYENICLMGCDYSKKYVKPLYTSLFGKLFAWATNQNYENYSAQLDDLKDKLSFIFEMIDVGADSWYVIDTGNTENMNVVNENFAITQYTKEDYNNQNEVIKIDVYSTYGSNRGYDITLTKDMVINNNFDVTGGTIDLNGYTLTVKGDYTITDGYLKMINPQDKVIVGGNFTIEAERDHTNYLTDGTMEIKGNFTQQGEFYGRANFNCAKNHKVIFNGTDKQIIHFDSPSSGFANVEFNNSNVEFDRYMRGWTLQQDTTIDNDTNLSTLDLNGHTLTINGSLQHSGTIDINGGTLDVKGDYTITDGYLKMTNPQDKVIVGGNFTIEAERDHTNYLTDGTMEIKGNFTQQGTYYARANFNCTNNHKVILNGTNKQIIHFNSTSSHFNILELTKDKETGYIFDPDNCWNELIITKKAIIGDVNNDGIVSIADATTLQKYLANIIDFDNEQLAVADTNSDGNVSIADATQIQKYLAQLIPSLG
ncbi:dockerin type I domain-containing protein [Ruminococcus sp.]|uniref:dockerin type I domain-containing protein n=1 Tax=Ruminococcus sp. TaxID=41978 RepID=UPI0025DB6A06|nr:dockerin type I domain-containing protein [Ruminococcus sp.]MCI6616858.1 dockerin type I domain-containing protein [Ruminococcus sp.]